MNGLRASPMATALLGPLAFALLASASPTAALSPEGERRLRDIAETRTWSLGRPVDPVLTPDGRSVLFLRGGPRDRVLSLFEQDVASGAVRERLDPAALLGGEPERLSVDEKSRRERQRITTRGFTGFELSRDGSRVLVALSSRLYVLRRSDGRVTPLPREGWIAPRFSPDGRFVAAVMDDDLFVIEISRGRVTRLTRGGTESLTRGLSEFVAQEEMDRHEGFWWSPDSERLVYQETDLTGVERLWISDQAHPERPPTWTAYPRAGTANARVRLGVVPRGGGATTWIRWDSDRYPYLARVIWEEEGAPLTLLVQSRDQREEVVLAADSRTGATRVLLTERDDAWLNLDEDTQIPRWLPDGSAFLWSTERRGTWQLELRDGQGAIVREVTPAGFHYSGVADLDPGSRSVVVAGGPDARERHLYRVSLDGGEPARLTDERGRHEAVFSDDHRTWVHSASPLDGWKKTVVRDAKGRLLAVLPSVAEEPPWVPRVELVRIEVPGSDGARAQARADSSGMKAGRDPEAQAGAGAEAESRTFDAAIVRPRAFEPARRYPVILDVYGGPTLKVVEASAGSYARAQWMADEGYIVVSLDGRGTPGRGREWERSVRGNLADIALEDQVAGLRALGESRPELDLARAGVYGWSFGGYMAAMAALRHPGTFRCGVAGAPVTRWEDYDTHYTERYMGLPSENQAGYRRASVLTWAESLERPLLIVHGLTDDNVYPVHSLRLADALLKSGRPYEMLLLPGTHMLADPLLEVGLWTRIMDFFDAHLRTTAGRPSAMSAR